MNSPAASQIIPSHIDSLAFAYQTPTASAQLRWQPEDFHVQETLSFEPSGNGNHVYLQIEKQCLTTEELAKQIARFAGVTARQIGYAGLKDRNAVTSQWFSVDVSGKTEPDWHQMQSDRMRLLGVRRHERKLKQGAIKDNRFHITLRNLQGDMAQLEERLVQVHTRGVPCHHADCAM